VASRCRKGCGQAADGETWERLATMTRTRFVTAGMAEGIPAAAAPKHATGGFVFPQDEIDAMKRQDGRDLTRSISISICQPFPGCLPAAMYLVQRPELGDVSQGKLVSLTNYFEMFNGILTQGSWKACGFW